MAAACVAAWLGQSLLLAGAPWAGVACFAAALGLCAVAWRPQPPAAEAPLPLALETLAWVGLTAAFVAASVYRIDVQPNPSIDEIAYFTAARMQVGDLEPGMVYGTPDTPIYDFTRFQSQLVPHQLQSAALRLLGLRLTSTRLASLVCAGAALLVFAACVRSRWGPRAALLTLGCSAAAPLLLAYGRRGYYIAPTELHAVACFLLLLRLERRRTPASAALLGALLGASIYLYQLSWFAAPLCAACLLATPSLWRRRHLPLLAALASAACLVALPGAWSLRDGLRQVYAQSVDKLAPGVRNLGEPVSPAVGPVRAATLVGRGLSPQALRALSDRYAARDLTTIAGSFGRQHHALTVAGPTEVVEDAIAELVAQGWRTAPRDTLPGRVQRMFAQLFIGPAPEQSGTWVSGPVLDPVVAPLLLLGIAVAWRRREDPLCRYLAVWVGLAWLLPALVAGPLPRRAGLVLPHGAALAALVLLEATRPPTDAPAWRRTAVLARAACVALAVLAGVGLQAGTWVPLVPQDASAQPALLALEDVVRGLPADQPILVTKLVGNPGLLARTLRNAGAGEPLLEPLRPVPTATHVRRMSCRHEPPFAWLTLDTPEQRTAFESLAADHELARFSNGGLLGLRVTGRTRGACGASPARRSP